jgi:AcrR family transcriptional regulator
MLSERTWEESSVTEIARRAGSSVGAFYSRFADKDGLLHALHERFMSEACATIDDVFDSERWDGASISDIMKECVNFAIRIYHERAGLLRAFLIRSSSDEMFTQRTVLMRRRLTERLRSLILARRKELLHPAPAIAAEFSMRLVQGVLQAQVFVDDTSDNGSRLDEEQLTTELVYATLAYMGVFSSDALDS